MIAVVGGIGGYFFRNPFLTPKSVAVGLAHSFLVFDKSVALAAATSQSGGNGHPSILGSIDGKFEWRHGLIARRNHASRTKIVDVMNSGKGQFVKSNER